MTEKNDFIKPNTVTILTTYQCTAACKECCFECSPRIQGKLRASEITQFIQEVYDSYKESLKLCVFTGGNVRFWGRTYL